MQKIINGIALLSGLVSLGVVVGGAWIYLEKDNMIHNVKTQMINGVTESITNALLVCWMQQCQNYLMQLVMLSNQHQKSLAVLFLSKNLVRDVKYKLFEIELCSGSLFFFPHQHLHLLKDH